MLDGVQRLVDAFRDSGYEMFGWDDGMVYIYNSTKAFQYNPATHEVIEIETGMSLGGLMLIMGDGRVLGA